MSDQAIRWIRFLRQYGPAAQNDSMYDETIRKYSRRVGIRQPTFAHPVEEELLGLFEAETGTPTSVILTGTAGDGKSNLCGKVWERLGGDASEWESKEVYFRIVARIGGRDVIVHVLRDLTGLPQNDDQSRYETRDELLQKLSSLIFLADRSEVFVLAANDGQLVENWRRLTDSPDVLKARDLFETLLAEDRRSVDGTVLQLFHLSRQASSILFDLALKAFVEHEGWTDCYEQATDAGFFGQRCPIRHNYELLKDDLVQERLRALMQLCDHCGLHVPIRRIFLLLTNAVLGHPECKDWLMRPSDVSGIIANGTVAKASLFNNVFGGNLSETRRESLEVFEYLNRFRIGYETSNRIDNILIFGSDDENLRPYFTRLMERDDFYGADISYHAAQREYVEGGDEDERASAVFLQQLVSQRRGLFFKIPKDEEQELRLWELTVFKFAGEYLARVVASLRGGGRVDRPIVSRIVKGLNRVFVGMLVELDRDLLLATSISFSGAKVSQLLEDRIPVSPRLNERVEIVFERGRPVLRVQLSDTIMRTLELNLARYEFLSRVAEGALPGSFSRECHEDILAFKSRVLAALAERRAAEGTAGGEALTFRVLALDPSGGLLDDVIEVLP